MTAFLAWIYAASNKVYVWFGNNFASLYSGAVNAWDWAVNFAESARVSAVNYALTLVSNARAYLINLIDYVNERINQLRDNVVEDLTAFTDWVDWRFSQIGNIAAEFVDALRGEIYDFIQQVRDDVNWLREAAIEYVFEYIGEHFGWVLTLRDFLYDLVSLVSNGSIESLLIFLNTWLNVIVSFFNNPVLFILDILQEKFLSYLEYLLAVAMGTTIYDLPLEPPWRK